MERQECRQIPREVCNQVPREQCVNVPRQVARQECSQIPRQDCRQVPREACEQVAKQVTYTQGCYSETGLHIRMDRNFVCLWRRHNCISQVIDLSLSALIS